MGNGREHMPRILPLALGLDQYTKAEASSNFADILARVRAGAEVVIESGKLPVAVVHAPTPPRRTISECIAPLIRRLGDGYGF